jgi:hypothetical protein
MLFCAVLFKDVFNSLFNRILNPKSQSVLDKIINNWYNVSWSLRVFVDKYLLCTFLNFKANLCCDFRSRDKMVKNNLMITGLIRYWKAKSSCCNQPNHTVQMVGLCDVHSPPSWLCEKKNGSLFTRGEEFPPSRGWVKNPPALKSKIYANERLPQQENLLS